MALRLSFFSIAGLLGFTQLLLADDGVALSRQTLAARVAELERANDLSAHRDAQSWSEDQTVLRRQLVEMLGLPAIETRDPELKATITGSLETDHVVVEKLHFQSLPGLYVTGNLYRPKQVEGRIPAILYVCGHGQVLSDGVSLGNKTYYQHHPAWFAEHGYVCLAIDTIQLGEIEGIHHGLYSFDRWDWPVRGYTPAGVEAWNAVRAIDYLMTRPDVDPNKMGITGRSGGGAYSWYAAAIDPRISVAVPVAGITDLRDHVVNQCVRGHCDCMYMVNRYGWDYAMLAAMIYPRPLLIGNTDKDPIFPLEGVERVHHQVRHVYQHGYKENLGIQWTTGGHEDTQELQLGCFVWFDHFLKGNRRVIRQPAEARFERTQLRVLNAIPNDQKVTSVQEWFVPCVSPALPKDAAEWETMCREWTEEVAGTVHGRVPLGGLDRFRVEVPLSRSLVFENDVLGRKVSCYDVEVPPGSKVRLVYFASVGSATPKRILVQVADQSKWELASRLIRHERTATSDADLAALRLALPPVDRDQGSSRDTEVVWVFPEGCGPWAWTGLLTDKDALHQKRSYLLCGWSLEGRQVAGVLRALLLLHKQFPKLSFEMHSDPEMDMIALHAALLSPMTLERLHLGTLPASYAEGFVLPGILRKCDLPQVLSAVASRHPTSMIHGSKVDLGYVRKVEGILGRNLLMLRTQAKMPVPTVD
jgi:hypothetical protein